ncbi:MAG: hypothetical protein KatS3mg109_1016 [Pirellulaceae bacterium]|nr:MAG: hypothetical protein KatS3mg109_0642 [Pirellulaceae bacterium]GIW90584.1 MAG: hypothetical protein KatS3mg109_1016 [Pirellulaceae bacterium]
MAEAKSQQMWAHTSCILAMIANVHRDPHKTRPLRPDDFNPYRSKARPAPKVGIEALKYVFVDR